MSPPFSAAERDAPSETRADCGSFATPLLRFVFCSSASLPRVSSPPEPGSGTMIIPVRCFTCGKVIADKWDSYVDLLSTGYSEK